MAEKDDRENPGDDLAQQQRQFLLELSSALQDRVPSQGIVFARMIQSSDTISDTLLLFLLLTVSAPPETGPAGAIKKSAGYLRLAYVHVPAYAIKSTFFATLSSLDR
jgi:hypothetical protein